MIEIRGDKKVLITPISEEDLADIKIGDIVWLDGEMMTCRDVAHRRLVEYGENFHKISGTKRFLVLVQSFVRSRELRMIMKWFLLDRQHLCVWRNLSMNLLNLPA